MNEIVLHIKIVKVTTVSKKANGKKTHLVSIETDNELLPIISNAHNVYNDNYIPLCGCELEPHNSIVSDNKTVTCKRCLHVLHRALIAIGAEGEIDI